MVATSFPRALSLTLQFEGGFGDDPRDPGGATNHGITQATLAQFRGHSVSKGDVKSITLDEAGDIYRQRYWKAVCGDQLPPGVDMCLFDLAVNSGPRKAIQILQAALGRPVNGILGSETLTEAQGTDPAKLIVDICSRRLSFLQRLTTFATFGRGWSRRVSAIEKAACDLAKPGSGAISHPVASNPSRPVFRAQPDDGIKVKHENSLSENTLKQEENHMFDIKNLVKSRTLWSNAIGLGAFGLSHFGLDISGLDQSKVLDSILQVVTAASFVSSSVFRVVATKKLL